MNKFKIKKNRYNVTLTEDQRKIVEKIAEQENCNFSDVIGYAIILLNKEYQWKN